MLNVDIYGEGQPPLMIVHGLYGSARNWGVISRRLSEDRRVVAVDQRNHGDSPWYDEHTYHDMANDLAQVIEAEMPGGAIVLGHSMGGKASMVLALTRPDLVKGLIVADIAPVAYDHTQIQFIEAMRGLDLSAVNTRGDANRLMAETVPEDGVRAFLLQSLDVKEKRWRLNLDVLAREMATVVGWPAAEMAGRTYDGPVLFLSGAESTYVTPAGREAAKAHFPNSRFFKIPGAGHWLHAEKPREFEAAVQAWIEAQAFS
ncbi:alpha/beta fold hydrolase [Donghicola mangrovi]|uniref:Alpha/beta fold hydrolase n=1 Tax=Donghicola mangrovi TaxID=2729614 RepID=A0A850QDD4_9RHOB|nr:alpha/beta fold hydrolase [Donghicola mangrovi]NVO24169.1 alpha/beta fold hydrolase [Donghicola mangrovi]